MNLHVEMKRANFKRDRTVVGKNYLFNENRCKNILRTNIFLLPFKFET